MHSLAFKALSEAIPRAVEAVFDWFKSGNADWGNDLFNQLDKDKARSEFTPSGRKRPAHGIHHKHHDHTPITGTDYDDIRLEKIIMDEANAARPQGTKKMTQDELTELLNIKLGLDKSKAFYYRIWSGHMDRPKKPTLEKSK